MFRKKHFSILMIGVITLSLVIIISLVYAGFTGQLNITGVTTARQSKWDIHFENLSSITTTGSAKVLSQPELDGTTTIEDYDATVTSPGDTISFTFRVVNEGNYNASISSVSVGTPQCSGTDSTSNGNVCSKLSYTLTYEGGATVQTGDVLGAKDSITMKITLTYAEFNDASLLPTEEVTISNLGITINYQQSGSALVKDNGEVTDYRIYHVGDKVTVNNEDYYVIANSDVGRDYVVALKSEPLTVAEVSTYGNDISIYVSDQNGYGGIKYGSTIYDNSDAKTIIENWTSDIFQSNELKEVDGYSARLITKEEYESISNIYNWRYNSKYMYWTMTSAGGIFNVKKDGLISADGPNGHAVTGDIVIRPVINVYKSAMEINNNE